MHPSFSFSLGLVLVAAATSGAAQSFDSTAVAHLSLMPMPASIHVDSGGQLALTSSFRVAVPRFKNGRLLRATDRAIARLARRTGLPLSHAVARDSLLGTLVIDVRGPGDAVQSVNENESYTLDVTTFRAELRAATVVGALRGLETFQQLVTGGSAGFTIPLAHIADRPRFPWRGLLIDVSRHFEPVDVIERNLDAMAAVKLNVLHWHLSDDQGFRVESKRYPKLQELGSGGSYYTQAQIREVVAYARDRGIRVVPEFDMPGHSISWFVGYPALASAPGPYSLPTDYNFTAAAFDPARESVYRFITRFVAEMAPLFPDRYWHIGGDEVDARAWEPNAAIHRFMRRHKLKDFGALQAYFNRRLARILAAQHKRVVGWDEILHPDLPHDVVIQSWRGQASLFAAAQQGYSGILSAGYYLDAMSSAGQLYAVDPIPAGADLDSAQAGRVLGGEACMWGELVTPETIDSRIWPRTAAIAERLWSPGTVVKVNDMYRRLGAVNVELADVGVHHLSGPDALWRLIAQTDGIAPLRELQRVVEPVSLGQRMHMRRPTSFTPLVAPGDIVTPDAAGGRALSRMLDTLFHAPERGAGLRDSLATMFTQWQQIAPAIAALTARAPLLTDADSAAAALATAGAIGAEALRQLEGGQPAAPAWTSGRLAQLDSLAAPRGLLRLAIIPQLRRLVLAAGGSAATTGQ
ncbi:MAG TPA: family 20 glycosylhydrolase [Gemmatimonadaceae bacterium]|nr:family 20 glycosylhydrolase [Gemmatimonadaceae bacterium]